MTVSEKSSKLPEALPLHGEKIFLWPAAHGIYTIHVQDRRLHDVWCPHLKTFNMQVILFNLKFGTIEPSSCCKLKFFLIPEPSMSLLIYSSGLSSKTSSSSSEFGKKFNLIKYVVSRQVYFLGKVNSTKLQVTVRKLEPWTHVFCTFCWQL